MVMGIITMRLLRENARRPSLCRPNVLIPRVSSVLESDRRTRYLSAPVVFGMPELSRVCVRDAGGSVLPGGFWAAVSVWLEKAQVLNKRLCGSCIERSWRKEEEEGDGTLLELLPLLAGLSCPGGDEEVLRAIRANEEPGEGRLLLLRTLIPKSNPHYTSTEPQRELVIKGQRCPPVCNGVTHSAIQSQAGLGFFWLRSSPTFRAVHRDAH